MSSETEIATRSQLRNRKIGIRKTEKVVEREENNRIHWISIRHIAWPNHGFSRSTNNFPSNQEIFLRLVGYVRRVELVKRERTVYRRRRRRKRASIEKIRRSVPPLLRPISLLLSPWRARGQRKQQHRSNNRQTRLVESFAPIALPYLHWISSSEGFALSLSPPFSFSPFPRSEIGSRGWKECTCQTLACTRTRSGR